ncbi:TetR/AcrR family transcriptional regulator C-terminal domain-containing protein [Streptomyces sp. NBC_00631]|uniref:TetR/AcrR family transcriptional regulator C-terminal domain-containing protein n=1 Tax=Streptomyces sp. NBC_00631 TaxID=2975793 RepID=UPI0030E1E4B8
MERIIAAAMEIVEEDGAEALSMRALAQRLGSGTATLYRHFGNRAALVAHVVDGMFGAVEVTAEEFAAMGWRQACRTIANGMFDILRRHRNAAPLLAEQDPMGPNAMALRERCIAVLLDNGFPPRTAAHAYATLAHYVLGFAIQLKGHGGPDRDDARVAAAFREVDPHVYPATAAVADALPVRLEDEFSFGLDLVLRGLDQLRNGE